MINFFFSCLIMICCITSMYIQKVRISRETNRIRAKQTQHASSDVRSMVPLLKQRRTKKEQEFPLLMKLAIR